jgi:hypothetical protein
MNEIMHINKLSDAVFCMPDDFMDHPMDYVTYRSLEYFNYEMVESYSYGV